MLGLGLGLGLGSRGRAKLTVELRLRLRLRLRLGLRLGLRDRVWVRMTISPMGSSGRKLLWSYTTMCKIWVSSPEPAELVPAPGRRRVGVGVRGRVRVRGRGRGRGRVACTLGGDLESATLPPLRIEGAQAMRRTEGVLRARPG